MKKFTNFRLLLLSLAIFTTQVSTAQTTGSYDDSVSFISATRKLSLYVPATYSSSTPCRLMVCLHGLGDNCGNYRNALITSLSWNTYFPNTIIICPEAATINSDFLLPAGNEAIIQTCIDYVKAKYAVDTTDIILQGFSYGGRSALKFGLDNYTKFKGLLLNTPALQGVKDAVNGHSAYTFNYANAAHIPVYMTHGQDDIAYEAPVDSVFDLMVKNDGIVKYLNVAGLGHSIPATSVIADVMTFFSSPARAGYDLDIVKNVVAQRSCSSPLPAICEVRNTGASTIHAIALNYKVDGTAYTCTWTGNLPSFKHVNISLPALVAADGTHNLDVTVASLDTTVTDTITTNNEQIASFMVQTSGTSLPLSEGFDGPFPPANWVQYLAGDFYTPWFIDSTVKKKGAASMGAFNTPLYFDNQGRKEEMATPVLNLSSVTKPHLSFDVAYNYDAFTPPYTVRDTAWADTLEVLISTDCGDTYHSLYKKGGADLATFSKPILNVLNIDSEFIYPADTNWRTEYIDLSSYASYDKAIIKFSYISGVGGSIYIDDVDITNAPLNVATVNTDVNVDVYPNPANDLITIEGGNNAIQSVHVLDVTGKAVQTVNNSNRNAKLILNTATLPDGFYIFQIYTNSDVQTKKITIRH